MSTKSLTRVALAIALAMAVPSTTAAQDEPAPEGEPWHLTRYTLDDTVIEVPWSVEATLGLLDGDATGSSGCNPFRGSYTLVDEALVFDPTFALTRAACPEPQASLEDDYLSLLPETASWAIDEGRLVLSDASGEAILVYERPVLSLTESDLAAISEQLDQQQSEIARASERIDNIRIGTLRDRIRELETAIAALQAQASSSAPGASSNAAFMAAERTLLRAIPQKVRRTCQPLRSGLPRGTVAAVACDGSRQTVAEQAYYLMEWSDAVATLRSVADRNGVPQRRPRCHDQRAGWIHYGTNLGAEACWSENGKGNYRLVAMATSCKQLDAGDTRLRQPAIYLAMEGVDDRMEPVRAAGLAYTDAGFLIMNAEAGAYIPARNKPNSPGCNARLAQNPGL